MSDSPTATESAWVRLRKRLFSRTTDLVAIAVVIFAGVTMGGSVLEWWRTNPEEVIGPNVEQTANEYVPPDWMSGEPVRIDAGTLNVRMQRSELTGSPDAVMVQMLVMLGEYAKEVALPEAEATAEERALLESLKELEPKWRDESGVAVYHQDAPVAAYTAVKADPRAFQNGTLLSSGRVVSWGLVVPAGESRWTAWLFAPKPKANGQPSFDWRDVLPKGARCDLALHSAQGHVMLSFSGEGDRQKWQTELDRSLEQRGFHKRSEWSRAAGTASVEYDSRQPSLHQTVTIHIYEHQSGGLQGLLHASQPLEETP
jgi:hypothetical protein